MTKNHVRQNLTGSFTLSPKTSSSAPLCRVRVILDPQHRAWQERRFSALWAVTRKADVLAWLALQAVVQQAHCPDAATLVSWANELAQADSERTGQLPGGLMHPDPSRHAFTPQVIRALLKKVRPGGLDQDELIALVQAALELDYRQGLNRQAKAARELRALQEGGAGAVTARPLSEDDDEDASPNLASPAPRPMSRNEHKRRAALWGQSLPLGLVDGAVRRLMGPLLHLPGLPREVPFGRIPQMLGAGSVPFITLKDVRPDGDSALLLMQGTGRALRLPAALFTMPVPWREAVVNAPGSDRFTDLAAQGTFGPDGFLLDEGQDGPGLGDEPCWALHGDGSETRGQQLGSTPALAEEAERNAHQLLLADDQGPKVRDARPIRAAVLTQTDGQWWAWLRLGGPVAALPPRYPAPTKVVVAVDLGILRLMTAWDGAEIVPVAVVPGAEAPDAQPPRPLALEDLKALLWDAESMESLRAAYFRLEPYLNQWEQALSPYSRVAFEAIGCGPRGPWDQPGGREGREAERERRDLALAIERSLLWVVVDRLATDFWPEVGRRSVVWSPRRFSSKCCPVCERAHRNGTLPPGTRPGRLLPVDHRDPAQQARTEQSLRRQGRVPRAGERWMECSRCRTVLERDEAGAMNLLQQAVWLGRSLVHVWSGLPGDLQAHLRNQTSSAELNYRMDCTDPVDVLDWRALTPPAGLAWDVVRPVVVDRSKVDWTRAETALDPEESRSGDA